MKAGWRDSVDTLHRLCEETRTVLGGRADDSLPELRSAQALVQRSGKLKWAASRPACIGLFGPSQAGKSFLVGALLSHDLGSLDVLCNGRQLDFLREINPAKGVESTGVVTRFSTQPAPPLSRGDFECQLLDLASVLESLATGYLVECTAAPFQVDVVERALRDAVAKAGPPASPAFVEAWDIVLHNLTKKYDDRHPYLSQLVRYDAIRRGAFKKDVQTAQGWLVIYSLLWGGPGYAPDLDAILRALVSGIEEVGFARTVHVDLEHVRAESEGASIIDASCLNALGRGKSVVRVYAPGSGREHTLDAGVLSALIAEIRLGLRPRPGSLLERADLLDFPGGRALKGINGFGPAELSTGKLDNGIEVYKRGKLTFLFEQYTHDREITVLLLCSPGPTKPEAIQLQSQVESWLRIRYGAATPTDPSEIQQPSLFLALTKFDMSLGALRSDNARDRWESRVQEACIDFWARGQTSWLHQWGGRGQAFNNLYWVRNPYADQMRTLSPKDAGFEEVKAGYFDARAVKKHIRDAAAKWAAVEGEDEGGLPRSGVPLLARDLSSKLIEDIKGKELLAEARAIHGELTTLLASVTPSADEAEEQRKILANAEALINVIERDMTRRCSGATFGELMDRLSIPEGEVLAETQRALDGIMPMAIRTSDRVKKLIVHMMKWWTIRAAERARDGNADIAGSLLDGFLRSVCQSKRLLPPLGVALFPLLSRNTVDTGLVATIIRLRVCDALVELFDADDRTTPKQPIRLSYSERVDSPDGGIDWTDVDFSEDSPASRIPSVEIVFAGGRRYASWKRRLGPFFVESHGGKLQTSDSDPATQRLLALLKDAQAIHVGP